MKKVLIIAAVLFVVMGIMATAGLLYIGYRVKNRIEQETAKTSDERRREASRPAPTAEVGGHRIDACSLLSKEEASEILGVTIERAQPKEGRTESSCQYFAKARSQEERVASVADTFTAIATRDGKPEPSVKPGEAYRLPRETGMEGLVKGIGGLAGPADAPYVAVTVSWENPRTAFSMLKTVTAGGAPGVKTTEDLAGIGDEAMMGPVDSFLAFVKGQTGVQIGLSQVPQGRDKGVAIARKIAARL